MGNLKELGVITGVTFVINRLRQHQTAGATENNKGAPGK